MRTPTLTQQLTAEAVGTGVLTLVVLASMAVKTSVLATPVLAGLTLAVLVFIFGRISGTHINPAVTLGLASVNKISIETGLKYISAQLAGAFVAYFFAQQFMPALTLPNLNVASITPGIGEVVGAMLFCFGIASVVFRPNTENSMASFVVGSSLLLGIVLASPLSLAVLNPAIAIVMKLYSWHYVLAPIVGAILGFGLFKFINNE